MTLTYRGGYGPLVAAIVDVDDSGSERRVVGRAGKGDEKKLRRELAACV